MHSTLRQPSVAAQLLVVVATALALAASRLLSESGDASFIWPPLGIAFGLVWIWGWRALAAVGAGLVLWGLGSGQSLPLLPVALLELAAGVVAARVLYARLRRDDGRALANTSRFYFAGAIVGGGLSAAVGAIGFRLLGLHGDVPFAHLFLVFWVAEAMGVLLLAGVTLALARDGMASLRADAALAWRWLLLAAVVLALFAATRASVGSVALPLLPLLVVWPALRARAAFLGVAVLVVTAAMIVAALGAGGPMDNRAVLALVLQVAGVAILAQLLNVVSLERRRMLERERERARSDLLTGLANERALREHLADRTPGPLLVLRLEDVSGLADLLGAVAAEEAERALAAELAARSRGATVARLDRGRYAVFPAGADLAAAEAFATALYDDWNGRVVRGEEERVALRPTLAVVMAEGDPEQALLAADLALAVAVAHTGGRLEVAASTGDLLRARRDLLRRQEEVKEALAERRFLLYAQPIVPVAAAGEGLHCEILLRLRQPDGTLQAPGYFFPAAERARLTGEIDRYVIRELLAWLRDHPQAAARIGKCAINLTGWSASDPTLAPWIRAQVQAHGIAPGKLCFEITESQAIASREVAGRLIAALREMGASVSLDDFGTGLATFDYLKSFPFDYLKIDGGFVRDLPDSPVDRAVVESVVSVARTMGLLTIAEFVEDERIAATLRGHGVDYLQGYGVGRPVPLEALLGE